MCLFLLLDCEFLEVSSIKLTGNAIVFSVKFSFGALYSKNKTKKLWQKLSKLNLLKILTKIQNSKVKYFDLNVINSYSNSWWNETVLYVPIKKIKQTRNLRKIELL